MRKRNLSPSWFVTPWAVALLLPVMLLSLIFFEAPAAMSGGGGPGSAMTSSPSPVGVDQIQASVASREHGTQFVAIDPMQIGNDPDSLIWSWGRFQGRNPQSIGVSFTEQALDDMFTAEFNGFPRELEHVTAPHLEPGRVYDVPFPDEVKRWTPFDHVGWFANAQGHLGPGFNVPHADVHFFTITLEQRGEINGELDDPNLTVYPPPGFLPEDFCLFVGPPFPPERCEKLEDVTGDDVPVTNDAEQGVHWIDSLAPELRGEPFRQVFIYGSYNGEVNFWEPMITKKLFQDVRAFLNDLESTGETVELTFAIKQPEKFHDTDFYPTQYTIGYDAEAGEFTVSLDDFVRRKGE